MNKAPIAFSPTIARFSLGDNDFNVGSDGADEAEGWLIDSRTGRMRLFCIVQCRGFFFAVLGSCLLNYY
jgi:hypothetical protein